MIFDAICKNIQFVVDDINGEKDYIADNYHLGLLVSKKNKIMFPELMNMYEDDSENVTISFSETADRELCALIRFYDKDDNDDFVGDIYLRGDSFTEFLTHYCGEL